MILQTTFLLMILFGHHSTNINELWNFLEPSSIINQIDIQPENQDKSKCTIRYEGTYIGRGIQTRYFVEGFYSHWNVVFIGVGAKHSEINDENTKDVQFW